MRIVINLINLLRRSLKCIVHKLSFQKKWPGSLVTTKI